MQLRRSCLIFVRLAAVCHVLWGEVGAGMQVVASDVPHEMYYRLAGLYILLAE